MPDKCHIQILPQKRKFSVNPGKSLMESLMEQNIFLRSDCGGKGICGKCRVKKVLNNGDHEMINSCQFIVSEDIEIEIPEKAMLSSHIITKAPVSFPADFNNRFIHGKGIDRFGIAADIGTTTIAIYLCNPAKGKILSSIAVKNPQALYGDDVMSRIGATGKDKKNLAHLQKLVVLAIEWGIMELISSPGIEINKITKMVAVGNPTMIHIFTGVDPASIGISPYLPAFYENKIINSDDIGFSFKNISVITLPQVSGFIGGDILSAAVAVDIQNQPEGTLLVDLGTNGELLLKGKGKGKFFATSCATGPAFEGASLSCGMQAIPGAVNRVVIKNTEDFPEFSLINPKKKAKIKPSGICGTGVISAIAQMCKKHIIEPHGAFNKNMDSAAVNKDASGGMQYVVVPKILSNDGSDIFISQKDIRSVQLGKSALITGIKFLLNNAGFDKPEKIIIAGAFGSFLDKEDMITLGMIPPVKMDSIKVTGNSAGAGAVMVLCDDSFLEESIDMSRKITTIDLACNKDFQEIFVKQLSFPVMSG